MTENLDYLFEATPQASPAAQTFDKDAWAAGKKEERQALFDLSDKITEVVAVDPAQFRQYLDTQSRFHRYSAVNALLISAQKPNATRLGDLDYWRKSNVFIKQSELKNGVSIFEPGNEYTRDDGSVGVSYNVKHVYDVSQANRRSVQATPPRNDASLIRALASTSPIPIRAVDSLPNDAPAMPDYDSGEILVKKGMSAPDICRALSFEIAMAEVERNGATVTDPNFTAYCVSYMFCKKNGFDVSDFDFSEMDTVFEGKDVLGIRAEISAIRNIHAEISDRVVNTMEQSAPKKAQESR